MSNRLRGEPPKVSLSDSSGQPTSTFYGCASTTMIDVYGLGMLPRGYPYIKGRTRRTVDCIRTPLNIQHSVFIFSYNLNHGVRRPRPGWLSMAGILILTTGYTAPSSPLFSVCHWACRGEANGTANASSHRPGELLGVWPSATPLVRDLWPMLVLLPVSPSPSSRYRLPHRSLFTVPVPIPTGSPSRLQAGPSRSRPPRRAVAAVIAAPIVGPRSARTVARRAGRAATAATTAPSARAAAPGAASAATAARRVGTALAAAPVVDPLVAARAASECPFHS